MTRINEDDSRSEAKTAWSVVVIHEDSATRQQAVGFCDQLVARFWTRFEFEVNWWSFDLLKEAPSAEQAAEKAARADVVVVASSPESDFPQPLKAWFETCLRRRGDREGLLVGLIEPVGRSGGPEGLKHHYLRNAAHRGGMDYLTGLPQDIERTIPDSLDSYTQRADQVTHLLDDILHQQTPPPGLLR